MMIPPMTLMNVISRPAIASPLTNFAEPSMAPKNWLSSSSILRRVRACVSSIRPAERSASIAICLPGMASRLKRAPTSAMRPEPLVMTTKFTITRIANTMMPMTKFPPMTNLPKASITWPAAEGPSCPSLRIRRVDAMLSPRRSMVAISSTVGNELKSSGFSMNSTVISTRTEKVMLMARHRSSSQVGIGMISITRMPTMPSARASSPRFSAFNIAAAGACAAFAMIGI